ncbi:MAG: hypothetical protein ABIT76_00295 [Chthoniobacterales bacterium]
MDVRFHCTKRVRHSGRKSKHRVLEGCPVVLQALRLNPYYGLAIPGFHQLRKMRLRAPGLNVGKSGGYRLIYRVEEMDEALYLIFLETYFKGDRDDLTRQDYKALEADAENILSQPMQFDWE